MTPQPPKRLPVGLMEADYADVEARVMTLLTVPSFTVDPVVMGGYDVLQSVQTPTGAAIRPLKAPPGWNRKARRKAARGKR